MIMEQKTSDQTNRILRPDIQYNNIEIKYPGRERIVDSPIPDWARID